MPGHLRERARAAPRSSPCRPARRGRGAVVAAVGVHGLAEQRDLAHAARRRARAPRRAIARRGPADLAAARARHDAEGAEHVAALHHRDEGAARRLARQVGVALRADRSARASASPRSRRPRSPRARRRGQRRGTRRRLCVPKTKSTRGEAAQERVALLLRDAAARRRARGRAALPSTRAARPRSL